MALDVKQIQEILKKPSKKDLIARADNLEQRLRFHTETNIAVSDIYRPTNDFLDWVKQLLPKDKYNIFLHLFRFPLATPAVVEDVYRELERVFYSRNSSSTYQFKDSTLEDDWNSYKQFNLKEPGIWKTVGWQKMKVSINSILIVDLPQTQTSEKPEPYFYWLSIQDVIDFKSVEGSSIDWIVFKQEGNRVAAFDESYYRVLQLNDKNEIAGIVSESKHDLGYCPARFFWTTRLTENQKDLKKNPITKELANLDWLLFFAISKRHLDLYAPYPIYSAYEADCTFENNATGDYCDGGFLRNSEDKFKLAYDGSVEQCPICSQKRIAGPGSFVEVPTPTEGVPDMRNPIQITTIDEASLKYNVSEVERLKNDIIVSVVGSGQAGGMVAEKEAINETQVAASFESKTAVLNALKTNFEVAQSFVDTTICKLRYGTDFISSSISWGTEFYVFTISELYDKYDKAKKNGASMVELDAIANQILEIEYKNNPLQLKRMLILKQIEPFRHYTLDEVLKLDEKQLVNTNLVKLKINFSTFVERFERENINIIEFASKIPMRDKITRITEKLLDYVKTDGSPERTLDRAAGQETRT